MNPEDCVLVGVINRKRDLKYAREDFWYRIPKKQMPRGFNANYVAFFLSGSALGKAQPGGIYYFAAVNGHELVRRRDLLPEEIHHKRAESVYYRVALDALSEKQPPVLNPTKRVVAFIYTTWDRFIHAEQIADLYSKVDYYVDRIYYALRNHGIHSHRHWEVEQRTTGFAPGLRVYCENGTVSASTEKQQGAIYLDIEQPEDRILAAIRDEITKQGGPATINIPMEGI